MRRCARPAPSRSRAARARFAALLACGLLAAACGGPKTDTGSGTDSAGPIVIGASVPLSGDLAGFGSFLKWGYEHAVKEVNDAGGLQVGGSKRKISLSILDDKTDPNQTSANTEKLISQTKAVALLGSCTPALVVPGALAAERNSVPLVTGCAPTGAFTSAKQWAWAWDLFFAEPDLAKLPFETLKTAGAQTNQKIAILHDNGPDGKIVGGQLWPAAATSNGYQVVANVEFPVENTDFNAAVQQAKNARADVVLVDAVTPQAVSIRKQMATAGYRPKVIVIEKGAEPVQFAQALGTLADGVLVGSYWDPSFPYPGAKELAAAYGPGWSQHIADSYTAAKVLFDAITRAGSTDRKKINDAIAQTDAQYPVGPVKFDDKHVAVLNLAEVQWRGGKTTVVWPKDRSTGSLLFPVPAS
jgi:branched-chain amino acid transport system substrate-binding protein